MHSLNLLDYADHSVKIPASMLNKAPKITKEPLWKTLFALWLDLLIVGTVYLVMSGLLSGTFHELLVSNQFQKAATLNFTTSVAIFSLVLCSYFFFSYFLNHGQSLGLFVINKRIPMEDKSFNHALQWAMFSSVVCLSCGLVFLFIRENQILAKHDYLYQHLVSEKELVTINLLERTLEPESAEETYLEAA